MNNKKPIIIRIIILIIAFVMIFGVLVSGFSTFWLN